MVPFPVDVPVLSAIVWRLPGVVDVRNELIPEEPNPEPVHPHLSEYEYRQFLR
jgi:hypothetical protein